jgi:aminoglycoside phosphotransferase (APT) family kinase protein
MHAMSSTSPGAPLSESELRRQDAAWQEMVDRAQAGWHTSEVLVREVVQRATGTTMVSRRRLLAGLSNEVYEVATAAGEPVIVRISHRDVPHFEQERWAIDRCREVGVPVPAILLLEHRQEGGRPLSVCVEGRLPGVPLGRVVRSLDRQAPRAVRLLREAGELLARLHTVSTAGYGALDARGRGHLPTWDRYLLHGLDTPARREQIAGLAAPAGKHGAGETAETVCKAARTLDVALAVLLDHRPFLRSRPSRLLHRDYEPWHIFVDEDPKGGITGVIDLESCTGGDPAYDLVQWHVIHDSYAPVDPVVTGYRAGRAWTADFERALRLGCVQFRVRELLRELDTLTGAGSPSLPGISLDAERAGAVRTKVALLQRDVDRLS